MLVEKNRREFLKFLGHSTSATMALPTLLSTLGLTSCATPMKRPKGLFPGIQPTFTDDLILGKGLNYHIVSKWGDIINKKGERFGFNCDFTSFLPMKGKPNEGFLWVNHESTIPQFIHNKETSQLTRSKQEIMAEQETVGGSILHIKKYRNKWSLIKGSKYNRRIHGRTPIPFSHKYKIMGTRTALGTLANCAGGQTPWGTFLSSEENYHKFYGEAFFEKGHRHYDVKNHKDPKKGFIAWHSQFPLPPEHYGWVVEINPQTGKVEKQILLGRARHEGATPVVTKNKKTVIYMGEDIEDGFLFKFVSTGMHLKSGKLYAADTKNGRWLLLDINESKKLKNHFRSQLEVLIYSRKAAQILGATPLDRPEDIEVNPTTGDILVALTNNKDKNNFYGGLLRIKESSDFDSLTFVADTWLSGGPSTGFACPDNLAFDAKGNLWMTVDISEKAIGKPHYKMFGNNGLFYIPMSGPYGGIPVQVASAPVDAEFTGPWFSPDYKTLFLSVQHPGSRTMHNLKKPTSTWPDGPGELPKPAVVAIQGPLLEKLTTQS